MIAMVFVTCLITANIAAVKLIEIAGFILDAGVVTFPVSYIVGDVLTEVYGYHRARQVIWLGFGCNLLTVFALWLGGLLPAPAFWDGQQAYARILGYTPRLLAASFLAYLVGEFSNAVVLAKMKIATRGRWLWARTIGSTVVGQGLDSVVFTLVAFGGTIPAEAMLAAICAQWAFKTGYEAAMTPVTYAVVGFLKRREEMDVYDVGTRFNPFLPTK
jgi:uncharacterized integral membrane protein (TIGR00697 family)